MLRENKGVVFKFWGIINKKLKLDNFKVVFPIETMGRHILSNISIFK